MFSLLIHAAVAAQRGQARASEYLREAIAAAEKNDMLMAAAAARYRLGEQLGDDEGATLVDEARGWLATQGVVNPPRMVEIVAPGFTNPG